jgi:hypothetical protein
MTTVTGSRTRSDEAGLRLGVSSRPVTRVTKDYLSSSKGLYAHSVGKPVNMSCLQWQQIFGTGSLAAQSAEDQRVKPGRTWTTSSIDSMSAQRIRNEPRWRRSNHRAKGAGELTAVRS